MARAMTDAAAARKMATDMLHKLDATMGLGPVTVLTKDLYVMARYILSLSRPRAGTWEPIASAPKDGTKILTPSSIVYWESAGKWGGCWHDGYFSCSPTHWQPLPTAPSLTTPPATEEDA